MSGFDLTTLTTNGEARRSLDKILLFSSRLKYNPNTTFPVDNDFPSLGFFEKLKSSKQQNKLEETIMQFQKDYIAIVNKTNKLSAGDKEILLNALFADVTYGKYLAREKKIASVSRAVGCTSLILYMAYKLLNTNKKNDDMPEKNDPMPEFLLVISAFGCLMVACILVSTTPDNTITHEDVRSFIDWTNNLANIIDDRKLLNANNHSIDIFGIQEAIAYRPTQVSNFVTRLQTVTREFPLQEKLLAQRFVDNPSMRRSLDDILSFNKENNESATHNNAVDVLLDLKYNRTYQTTMLNLLDISKIAIQNSQLPQYQKNKLLDTILKFDGRETFSHSDLRNWIEAFSIELNKTYNNQSNQGYVLVPTAKLA